MSVHTNQVIQAGHLRARDEQQMQNLLQQAQYEAGIYNPDLEPEHERYFPLSVRESDLIFREAIIAIVRLVNIEEQSGVEWIYKLLGQRQQNIQVSSFIGLCSI